MPLENPVIPYDLRPILRENIRDCRDENTTSSIDRLEERYASHVEMLLDEVERLETAMERLSEEYIREKWELHKVNQQLVQKIVKHELMRDIFGPPTKTVQGVEQ